MGFKMIVGLGNPGPQYARTRHNVGFQLVDALARAHGLSFARQQLRASVADGHIAGQRVLLVKPLTFMNLSGEAVGSLMHFYKLPLEDLIVVYDDLDLPIGRMRLRPAGGSGGHKGMRSIVERLGSDMIARLRIGIGRPVHGDPVDYVLEGYRPEEQIEMDRALDRGQEALLSWLSEGLETAMNRFNPRTGNGEGQSG